MIKKLISALLGDPNEKELKKKQALVTQINAKEVEYQALSEEAFKTKTPEFIQRVHQGESLDELMIEAFALVKNACRRLNGKSFMLGKEEKVWDMIPYDCQLIGGMVLHEGKISEMKTGEGKTLVASLPLYLNALTQKGVHLVTVNDYLAKRDAQWIGVLYHYLGLSVGVVVHGLPPQERQAAYQADITYGTNNEFGFDYLRDNMVGDLGQKVQRGLTYAIVDEVDSILIDEARTPLIISAPAEESTEKYYQYARLINQLAAEKDYVIDEKARTATLTEEGIVKMEQLMGVDNIYTEAGFNEVHHIEQSLKAQAIFKKDIDYVIKENEIVIVDEFTGRLMPGRRYSDGLHQAIEAKEGVEVKRESKTLATITFQNYFRLYEKLSGMTGTAKTEEEEFYSIYGLDTIVIPTNQPVIRQDLPDLVFKNAPGKWNNVVRTIQEHHRKGQPILVGTISVETSEMLSAKLTAKNIQHQVLNAKHHEREAEIVAEAGQKGAVTIATNMAGRGTDIKIDEEVRSLGGLVILGTERHDSRRIDNQLRGRAGRQGDPGLSRFYLSMEDDLMRLFGGDRMKDMMEKIGLEEDLPIENSLITRGIESAQKRVEGRNFDIRKHILEYDDVMNKHREIMYKRRWEILQEEDIKQRVLDMLKAEVHYLVTLHTSSTDRSEWDLKAIVDSLNALLPQRDKALDVQDFEKLETGDEMTENLQNILGEEYRLKEESLPEATILRQVEKQVSLRVIDSLWQEHITQMTELRETVSLRGYGQRNPLMEYKQEAFRLFKAMLDKIQHNIINTLFKLKINVQESVLAPSPSPLAHAQTNQASIESNLDHSPLAQLRAQQAVAQRSGAPSPSSSPVSLVGRNDPCPCGSGKKYKKCHGLNRT